MNFLVARDTRWPSRNATRSAAPSSCSCALVLQCRQLPRIDKYAPPHILLPASHSRQDPEAPCCVEKRIKTDGRLSLNFHQQYGEEKPCVEIISE